MQPRYGNTASASESSQRVEDSHNSRRHKPVGPSRTRLTNRHNPYATTVPEQDTNSAMLKGQHRNRRERRPRPPTKQLSVIDADVAMAVPSGTWEGVSQDASYLQLPKSAPAPTSTLPEVQPDHAPVYASTTVPSPPRTPRLVARDPPLDEFGLYSLLEYEDNYGSNFFDSFNLGYSISHPEWTSTPVPRVEEETIPNIPHVPTPKPARRSAGKINLSNLHHRMMRSKGYVPDISLDQLDGVVRKQILRQADQLMFEYQAQSREQRKWRGYREPEDDDLLKRPKRKVRFNPCSTEGRNRKKRTINSCVDELVYQVHRIQLSA